MLSVQSAPTGTSSQFFSLAEDFSSHFASCRAILVLPVPEFPVSITNGFASNEATYLVAKLVFAWVLLMNEAREKETEEVLRGIVAELSPLGSISFLSKYLYYIF